MDTCAITQIGPQQAEQDDDDEAGTHAHDYSIRNIPEAYPVKGLPQRVPDGTLPVKFLFFVPYVKTAIGVRSLRIVPVGETSDTSTSGDVGLRRQDFHPSPLWGAGGVNSIHM